jgi:hypothetical protein
MIESVANRMDASFVFNENRATLKASDPLYKGSLILNEECTLSFCSKRELYLKQAYPVGFSILELSKLILARLFYDVLRPSLNNRVSVAMSDTDSVLILAPGTSPDAICKKLAPVMDFANYDKSHELYDNSRKNVVGLLKNEISHSRILRYAGIRSKTYAFVTADNVTETRAKGVSRPYKKKIAFETYKQCVDDIRSVTVQQVGLQAKNHDNLLVQTEKCAFNSLDDKRWLLCPRHSTPHGSWLITYQKATSKCYFCEYPKVFG